MPAPTSPIRSRCSSRSKARALPAPDVWYVGDTALDMECAARAGCTAVLLGALDPEDQGFAQFPAATPLCRFHGAWPIAARANRPGDPAKAGEHPVLVMAFDRDVARIGRVLGHVAAHALDRDQRALRVGIDMAAHDIDVAIRERRGCMKSLQRSTMLTLPSASLVSKPSLAHAAAAGERREPRLATRYRP